MSRLELDFKEYKSQFFFMRRIHEEPSREFGKMIGLSASKFNLSYASFARYWFVGAEERRGEGQGDPLRDQTRRKRQRTSNNFQPQL